MHPTRYALALALSCTVAFAGQSGAATPPSLVLPDAANDANALNGSGAVNVTAGPVSTNGNVTPVGSQPDKDFTKVTLAPTTTKKGKKTVCTGFTATITLSGPPGAKTIYRITGTTKVNKRAFWLIFDGAVTELGHGEDTSTTGSTTYDPLKRPAVVTGSTIKFTVLESDLKAAGEKVSEFAWAGLGAHSRTTTGVATVPLWDSVIVDKAKTFSLC